MATAGDVRPDARGGRHLAARDRGRVRPPQPHRAPREDPVEPPTDAAASPDHYRDLDLERGVRRLPPRERLAVALYYFLDLDTAETAAVMGCSTGTVKATLHHARARLRAHLEGGR